MITVRFRATKRGKFDTREFQTNIDAERFVRSLPDEVEVQWEGSPERPDPKPARAMWTGAVGFGMVNIPIKLYSATEDPTPETHQLCREHLTPMKYKRWCEHGHELGQGDTVKAVGRENLPVTDQELAELPRPEAKMVNIAEFVPAGSIPAMHRDKPYYLAPEKTGRHAYDLLVAALADTKTVAICKLAIRDREHLAALETDGRVLSITLLRRSAEIRSSADLLAGEPSVDENELAVARQLVKAQTSPRFEPARYPDEYADALGALVLRKSAEATPIPEANDPKVIELLASLKDSVERAKKARGAKPHKEAV